MNQYQSLIGRRPNFFYSDIVRSEAPAAMSRFFTNKQYDLQEDLLEQQKTQYDQEMQYLEDQASDQQDQANVSNILSTVSLATEAAPYVSDAASYVGEGAGALYDMMFADAAAGGAAEAAAGGAAGSGAGASGAAGGSAGGSGAGSGAGAGGSGAGSWLTTAGYIAAAIAAQDWLANDIERDVEGQPPGGVFNVNDDGNWDGYNYLASDPWKSWTNEKLDFDPTAGEELDASIYNSNWDQALMRTPAALSQWLDPIGDFGSDMLGGILDKNGVNDEWQNVATSIVNPIGSITDEIADIGEDSYICGAVERHVGMEKRDMKLLADMYAYALKKRSPLGNFYMKHGPELVRVMTCCAENPTEFFREIKRDMIMPVVNRLRDGMTEEGLDIYIRHCVDLCEEFLPELHSQIPVEG